MKFIGVDPGASGAIAIIEDSVAKVFDTPTISVKVGKTMRNRVNLAEQRMLLDEHVGMVGSSFALIERVQPQPKFGASSMFWMGHSLATWETALSWMMVPYETVRAQEWKKCYGLKGEGRTKGGARHLAIRLFPALAGDLKRIKDDGRAEALLIAEFARRRYCGLESLVGEVEPLGVEAL